MKIWQKLREQIFGSYGINIKAQDQSTSSSTGQQLLSGTVRHDVLMNEHNKTKELMRVTDKELLETCDRRPGCLESLTSKLGRMCRCIKTL